MTLRVLVIALAFLAGSLTTSAPAWAVACPQAPEARVRMRVIDPVPRVVYRPLAQINATARSHGLVRHGSRVLGTTESEVKSAIKARFSAVRVGEAACVSVTEVTARFGLTRLVVNLPREYPRGSCQLAVVRRHEMAHVDVNRRTVRKYAAQMKAELEKTARALGAVRARSPEQGRKVLQARLQRTVIAVTGRYEKELNALHAAIDKPGSPYDAAGACRGW